MWAQHKSVPFPKLWMKITPYPYYLRHQTYRAKLSCELLSTIIALTGFRREQFAWDLVCVGISFKMYNFWFNCISNECFLKRFFLFPGLVYVSFFLLWLVFVLKQQKLHHSGISEYVHTFSHETNIRPRYGG